MTCNNVEGCRLTSPRPCARKWSCERWSRTPWLEGAGHVGCCHAEGFQGSDGHVRGGHASWPCRGLLLLRASSPGESLPGGLGRTCWRWTRTPFVREVIAHAAAVREVNARPWPSRGCSRWHRGQAGGARCRRTPAGSARTHSGRAGGARARHGWEGCVPGGRDNEREDCERRLSSARSTHTPPRPVYPAASTVSSCGHPCCFQASRVVLSNVEGRWGRWGRMDTAAVSSERQICRPSSRQRQCMALDPATFCHGQVYLF